MSPARNRPIRLPALALLILASASSCDRNSPDAGPGAAPDPAPAVLTGSVTYSQRMALTDQARLEVVLEDVSRQDVAAPSIATLVAADPGQVPIRFELPYDRRLIDPRMSYAVRASIHDRGRLVFTSDTAAPVLTRGAARSEIALVLAPVASAATGDEATGHESDSETLEGMFRYLADAARFRDCRTGKDYAVSMENAFIELERAYLNSGIEPGSEIMVRLAGRYLERPPMEGNINEVKLIVDRFDKTLSDVSCAPLEHASLEDTYWKLTELGGGTVVTPEGMREAHLVLASAGSTVRGHAGCNNFFGSFETGDGNLRFSALGSTMMSCPEAMDTEQAFLEALGKTTRYGISGQVLTLYAGEELLARLEATYL